MAKRSQRRPVRGEKEQSGCMSGLISIFDFRQGHSTQKLLSDRRRGTRNDVGSRYSRGKLNMRTDFDEKCQNIDDDEGTKTLTADVGKTSVKKLMEEEMSSELYREKQITSSEVEQVRSHSEHGGHLPRNRKKTNKNCERSCDLHGLKAAASLEPQQSSYPNSVKQSLNNLDLVALMEEFCSQVHQCPEIHLHDETRSNSCDVEKEISCVKHDQLDVFDLQRVQKHSVLQEKLRKVTEAFIDQNFIDVKHLPKDGTIHQSKQFMNALDILNANKELFLKLLQDPNSLLVKHIQDPRDAHTEKDEITKSSTRANLSEEDIDNSTQHEELVSRKQLQKQNMQKIFRRKIRSWERNLSKGSDNPQASNKIVVLKPGPAGMRNCETETNLSSSPQSNYSLRNKEHSLRVTSNFSFTEIKRKLKHAMRKERHWISMDGILPRVSYERQDSGDSGKVIAVDTVGRDSPSKTYFHGERTTKHSTGVEKREEIGKPRDWEPGIGLEFASTSTDGHKNIYANPKQRESNIYMEAKKHLSEMLSTGDEDEDLSSRQLPGTLGRILSLPEYILSPKFSPGRDRENGFVTAQMRYSSYENRENMWWLKQENNTGHLSPLRQAPSCTDYGKPSDKLQVFDSNSDISKELFPVAEIYESICSVRDESSPEGDMEIVQTADIVCPEESSLSDVLSEPNRMPSTSTNKNADTAKICEEGGYSKYSGAESPEDIQLLSSSLRTCSSSSLIIQKVEDPDSMNEIPERRSPVSVLEPFFIDDAFSPASTISQPGEPPMQPLRIHFEEHDSYTLVVTPSDPEIHLGTCMEDKKSLFEYVRAVLQASGFSWEEFLERWHSSEQLLDLSLFDEVELLYSQFCGDRKLLFDCINEVLVDLCDRYFGCSPWVSFVKPNIRPLPVGKNIVSEVWEGIDWHLIPQLPPRTLDQIVGKDLAKSGTWMDLRFNTEDIGMEMEEAILEELMEDAIFELCT
ncbi:hypothetical protein HHK36_027709 [Tetracentron sinense]|uniref:DUF4378 domain-containing protein n=1 Tax=Tetracentron sinense TaxID=13715 RepID=A0A835D1A8_TETSI|nr:hypothetical protein HHK36_027709 [Tetracentron sinense]